MALVSCARGSAQCARPTWARSKTISFAGPLVADNGTTMVGSLPVIDSPSREAAHAWLALGPFVQAGVFAGNTVQVFLNLWCQ